MLVVIKQLESTCSILRWESRRRHLGPRVPISLLRTLIIHVTEHQQDGFCLMDLKKQRDRQREVFFLAELLKDTEEETFCAITALRQGLPDQSLFRRQEESTYPSLQLLHLLMMLDSSH